MFGRIFLMRKAEVRTSRLATKVVWPNMSRFLWEYYVCGLDLLGPLSFFSKKMKR